MQESFLLMLFSQCYITLFFITMYPLFLTLLTYLINKFGCFIGTERFMQTHRAVSVSKSMIFLAFAMSLIGFGCAILLPGSGLQTINFKFYNPSDLTSDFSSFWNQTSPPRPELSSLGVNYLQIVVWIAIICTLFFISLILLFWLIMWIINHDVRNYLYSMVVYYLGTSTQVSNADCRNTFRNLPRTSSRVDETHTHGTQASNRSDASSFADRLGASLGTNPSFIQLSKSDKRNGRVGSRTYYWTKDLDVKPEFDDDVHSEKMRVMIDVDYYYDMPSYLAGVNGPVFLYTFQPTEVSSDLPEYSYSFDENSLVTYNVSGGAVYTHCVWSYNSDVILCSKKFLGVSYATQVFNLDKRYIDKNHQMILFSPICKFGVLGSFLASYLGSNHLKRLILNNGNGFNVLQSRTKDETLVSIGKPNDLLSANLPRAMLDGLCSLARTGKYDLTQHQVHHHYQDELRSALVLEYIKTKTPLKAPVVYPIEDAISNYIINPIAIDVPEKPMMTPFMKPLVLGSYVPANCLSNEQNMVEERIVKPRAPAKEKNNTIPASVANAMRAWIARAVPKDKRHKLHPKTVEDVFDAQGRPSQRRILHTADISRPTRVIKNFPKKEPYMGIKPMRPVSQINGTDKLHYSRYIYSVTEYMHNFKWYAFGISNRQIAERVAFVCSNAKHVVKSDFSKFDGHVSWILRELEHQFLMALFDPQYHEELQELHESQYGMKAYCPLGTKYEQFFARASGSPETSCMNSVLNSFVNFLALWFERVGTKKDHGDWCWEHLGIYGGDDGLTADVSPANLTKASSMVFLEVTCEPVYRGNLGVSFLARDYSPFVWFGDLVSMCSLFRQLSKLHLTVILPANVTALMKLEEKLRAYYYTDRNSPVFDLYIHVFQRLVGEFANREYTNHLRIWGNLPDADLSEQYPNESAEWMYDNMFNQMPGFDYTLFRTWILNCKNTEDMLNPPVVYEPGRLPTNAHNYILNGTLVVAEPARWVQVPLVRTMKLDPDRVNSGPIILNPAPVVSADVKVKNNKQKGEKHGKASGEDSKRENKPKNNKRWKTFTAKRENAPGKPKNNTK